MEYQLKLLKIFNKDGFTKIVDLLDELLSDEENLLNFIILNINNINNIKYLCTFLKKNMSNYINLINNIINNESITMLNKEFFLLNILNTYNKENINLINDNSIKIIYENLKYNNDIFKLDVSDNLSSIILYKILNSYIFDNEQFDNIIYEEIYSYYNYLFKKIEEISSDLLLDFIYNICNIYNYRCKTYSTVNITDNILFIFIYFINNKYKSLLNENEINNNNLIVPFIEKNIDINNILYDDVKSYDKSLIYEILLLKLIHITIPYSISEIEHNNTIIYDYSNIIYKIKNSGLLNSFSTIQNYIVINNEKKIKKYENYNLILNNKLNKVLLEHIYDYYVNLLIKIFNNKKFINNELFSNIIINIIDFYKFYTKTKEISYIYSSLEEKYNCLQIFIDIFNSSSSNINLDIKIVDFFDSILHNEILGLVNKINININTIINKSFIFYTQLDNYEDYYKNGIKYKVIYIYNNLFYTSFKFKKKLLNIHETNNISKFLISFIEDININITNFIIYYKFYLTNRDYSTLANSHYIYLEEFLRFYKFMLNNYIENIESCIIEISIKKFNKNIIKLNQLCTEKNNVYKLILYIIDIYLILDNTQYLQYIKNDTYFFKHELFIDLCDNLYIIYKHKNISLFKDLINKINDLEVIEENEYEDIPDEFLDPLCNTLMITPVLLPSSGQYVDLDVIKKHLLYHNFDPFNREELTLEILEEYNNRKEIKKKISIFTSKIDEWKKTK